MSHPIVYIDKSTVRDGQLTELKTAMKELAGFVEANMPRLLSYAFFLNENQTQMTVVAIHPDSASLEFHLDTGAEEFRKFANLIDLLSIEVYGQISDAVIDRLEQKAEMLGSGTLTVHEFYAGFARKS
jgi:hypothetical protein